MVESQRNGILRNRPSMDRFGMMTDSRIVQLRGYPRDSRGYVRSSSRTVIEIVSRSEMPMLRSPVDDGFTKFALC